MPAANLLQIPLRDIREESVRDLLDELEQVTGLSVEGHGASVLFQFLSLCQLDVVKMKRVKIQAKNFYKPSLLKTRLDAIPPNADAVYDLTIDLCENFKVHHGLALNRQLYVFLNEIYNPKSALRKLPPIRL
ncbi:MAG: hypothetical protein RL368_1764 [Pseudomonadota bacterium]|jgi:hypothetical protein